MLINFINSEEERSWQSFRLNGILWANAFDFSNTAMPDYLVWGREKEDHSPFTLQMWAS